MPIKICEALSTMDERTKMYMYSTLQFLSGFMSGLSCLLCLCVWTVGYRPWDPRRDVVHAENTV